jgi:hypothetical protein
VRYVHVHVHVLVPVHVHDNAHVMYKSMFMPMSLSMSIRISDKKYNLISDVILNSAGRIHRTERYSSTRFFASGFFHESTPCGPLIHTIKQFRILVRISRDIRIKKFFLRVSDPTEQKTIFQIGGSLSINPICLG